MNKQQRIERAKKAVREKWNRYFTIETHYAEWFNSLETIPLDKIPVQNHDETGYEYYARVMKETLDQWYDRMFKYKDDRNRR